MSPGERDVRLSTARARWSQQEHRGQRPTFLPERYLRRGRPYNCAMSNASPLEAWQRGPVEGIPPLLMPAAHAILHAQEDAARALAGLSTDQIWERPAGAASVGFHIRHLAGALDRLLTYARSEQLTDDQRRRAAAEREPGAPPSGAPELLDELSATVDRALVQLRGTAESTLLEPRGIGRQQIPSTVIGLLFHAAEHAARHAGQALTTARIVAGDAR
jgi:uncharacterized damage-inducible protein DinB